MKLREVSGCDDCPCFWQNMEFPQSRCKLHKDGNLWGMCHRSRGDPTPKECPLRDDTILLVLDLPRGKR